MIRNSFRVASLSFLTFAISYSGRIVLAQDPVKLAPNNYNVALDNDNVRVLTITVKPGEKIGAHSHPDHVVYAINGGKVKFTDAEGKTKDVELKSGEAKFAKAETHQAENIGTTELKLVEFELKKPATPGAKLKIEGDDQMKAAPDNTKVVLDNDRVRLLETKLKAGGKLAKHAHPAYVVYAVTDAKYKTTVGDKTEEKSLAAGMAMAFPPTAHAVENVAGSDVTSLILEFKE
ncbi:MAG: cupin domain-containing protein [Planctomycetes bacterium]|nr:cupin domain-containing protein [Planctomycetota bacterium]MBI3834061.1 cupin domain-containing protein [Planctomycetota bacterium]